MNFNWIKSIYQKNIYEGKSFKVYINQRISHLIDGKSKKCITQLVKIYLLEMQILINIVITCYQYDLHSDTFSDFGNFPYDLSTIANAGFFIAFGGQTFSVTISLLFTILSGVFYIFTIYAIINIVFCQRKHMQSMNFRSKWIKFVIYYHIPIIFYVNSNWYIRSFNMLKLYYKDFIDQNLLNTIFVYSLLHILNISLCVFILELTTHLLVNHNQDGKRNKIGIYVILILQSVFTIMNFFNDNETKKFVLYFIIVIFLLIRTWEIFYYPTYYNLHYMKVITIFHGIDIGFILIRGIFYEIQNLIIMPGYHVIKLMTCINLIVCPLIARVLLELQKRFMDGNLVLELQKKVSINRIISKYLYFSTIFGLNCPVSQEQNDRVDLIFRGLVINHLKQCMNCKIHEDIFKLLEDLVNKNYVNLEKEKVKVHILEKILKEGIIHDPTVNVLSLLNLELIVDNANSIHRILLLLNNIQTTELTNNELLTYNILKAKIHSKMRIINQDKSLNVEPLIISSKYENFLINGINSQAKNHLKWWKMSANNNKDDKNKIDIEDMVKLAIKIDCEYSELKHMWSNQLFTYEANSYIKPLLIYGLFLEIIKNNHYESELLLKKYYQIKVRLNNIDTKCNKISNDNLCSEKNVMIRLSIYKNQLGNITACSNNVHKMLGFTKKELLQGKFIEDILPKYYRDIHKVFVSNYFKTGYSKKFIDVVEVYPQHKSGYLVPLSMSATLVPDLIQGVYALSVMRETKMIDDMILISLDGKIIGLTMNLMNEWKIKQENINNVAIWNICHALKRIIRVYKKAIQYQINKLDESNNFIKLKYDTIPEKTPSLKSSDNNLEAKILELDNLIKKYSNEGEILEYNFSKFTYTPALAFYHTFIYKESYQNNISILRLCLSKVDHASNACSKVSIANIPFSFKSLKKDSLPSASSENINSSILTLNNNNNNNNMIGSTIIGPQVSIMKATKYLLDAKPIENKQIPSIIALNNNITRNDYYDEEPNELLSNNYNNNNLNVHGYTTNSIITKPIKTKSQLIIKPKLKKLEVSTTSAEMKNPRSQGNNHNDGIITQYRLHRQRAQRLNHHHYLTKDDFKREENQEDSSYYTKKSSKKHMHDKIHKALEKSYTSKSLRNQLLLIPLILFITIIIMLSFGELAKSVGPKANSIVDIIYKTNQRTVDIIELYHRVKILWMIKGNYTDKSRFCYINNTICATDSPNISTLIGALAKNLLENTSNIVNFTGEFDTSLQEIIYEDNIMVYNMYTNGTISMISSMIVNQFVAIDTIFDQCVQLAKIPYEQIDQNTIQLRYILNNTMNKLILSLTNSNTKIIEEMNIIIRKTTKFLNNAITIIIPIAFLIWSIIAYNTMKIFKYNKCILYNVARLPIEYYFTQISTITDYINELNNENYNNKKLMKNNNTSNSNNNALQFIQNKSKIKFLKKRLSSRKYFLRFFIKLSILLMIVISLLFIFIAKYLHRQNLSQSRINSIDGILIGLNQIYYQSLSLAYLYEYISTNGSSHVMDNQPIYMAFDSALEQISSQNDFIESFKFISENDDPELEHLIYGNACALIAPNTLNITQCIDIASGPSQRGLIGLNSYAIEVITTIKHSFENSNRTQDDILKSLDSQSLRNLENILFTFTSYFYNSLYEISFSKFKKSTALLIATDSIWIGISITLVLIAFFVLWLPIFTNLLMEFNYVKKVIKILPKNYILSNIIIKRFIIYTSSNATHISTGS